MRRQREALYSRQIEAGQERDGNKTPKTQVTKKCSALNKEREGRGRAQEQELEHEAKTERDRQKVYRRGNPDDGVTSLTPEAR